MYTEWRRAKLDEFECREPIHTAASVFYSVGCLHIEFPMRIQTLVCVYDDA
jgi:hypothetical protein